MRLVAPCEARGPAPRSSQGSKETAADFFEAIRLLTGRPQNKLLKRSNSVIVSFRYKIASRRTYQECAGSFRRCGTATFLQPAVGRETHMPCSTQDKKSERAVPREAFLKQRVYTRKK